MVVLPGLQERLDDIGRGIAEKAGFEFVHCQIAGSRRSPVVRVFIDKPGGVTIDDCAVVSREMEDVLDREDLIPTSYVLEVSSPGIERELFSLVDFKRFVGHDARIKTVHPVGGQRNFSGTIETVDGQTIDIIDRTSGKVSIPFDSVVKANLVADLQSEFKKA